METRGTVRTEPERTTHARELDELITVGQFTLTQRNRVVAARLASNFLRSRGALVGVGSVDSESVMTLADYIVNGFNGPRFAAEDDTTNR
jgi:hypothetical protein